MVPDRTRTDHNQSSGENPSPGGRRYSTALLNRRECLKLGAAAAAIAGGIGVGTSAARAERAHDITFDTVVDAVTDAGMDPTGETPIDDQLDSVLESDTLVQFPAGEYLLTDEHILTGVSNIGIQGRGDSPSDVRFVFPEGNSGAPDATDYVMFWIEADSGVLLENFEIHQTGDRRTGASIVVSAEDKLVVQDLSWQGFNPAVSDANEACLHPSVTSAEGSGRVTGLTIDGGGVAATYPGCRVGVAVRGVHEGDLALADLDVRELGAPALRATNCPGAVRVENSHFENNDNGNVLLGGGRDGRSYLKNCTVVVDESRIRQLPSDERYESLEGVRIDAGGQGWTGVTIEDCQFLFESLPDGAAGRAVISRPTVGDHGAFTVRNSTLSVNTPDCVPVYAASPGRNLTRSSGVSLENVHITGTQSSNDADSVVFIQESHESAVSDCCISFPNGTGRHPHRQLAELFGSRIGHQSRRPSDRVLRRYRRDARPHQRRCVPGRRLGRRDRRLRRFRRIHGRLGLHGRLIRRLRFRYARRLGFLGRFRIHGRLFRRRKRLRVVRRDGHLRAVEAHRGAE